MFFHIFAKNLYFSIYLIKYSKYEQPYKGTQNMRKSFLSIL